MKTKQSTRSRKGKKKARNQRAAKILIPGWFATWIDRNRPEPLEKQWSTEEPEAILDYLHGDVTDGQLQAACYYEYARESETLRKARREYDPANAEQSSFPGWVAGPAAAAVWQCLNYPALPWGKLTDAQQKELLLNLASVGPRPVITDVRILAAMKIFEKFEQAARAASKHHEPMVCPARVKFPGVDYGVFSDGYEDVRVVVPDQKEDVNFVVFTLNYKDGMKAVKEGISRWLHNEENQNLFGKYYMKPIHKQNPDSPDHWKELLKFLAAWRLYNELGFKKAAEWTKKNRRQRRDAGGVARVRRFFGEKQTKLKHRQLLVETPLYKEQRYWKDAKRIAQLFLATEIECGVVGDS
jgi:hypothetical protein